MELELGLEFELVLSDEPFELEGVEPKPPLLEPNPPLDEPIPPLLDPSPELEEPKGLLLEPPIPGDDIPAGWPMPAPGTWPLPCPTAAVISSCGL